MRESMSANSRSLGWPLQEHYLTLPYATHLVETSTTIMTFTMISRMCQATGGHLRPSTSNPPPNRTSAKSLPEMNEHTSRDQAEHHSSQAQTHHHEVEQYVISAEDDSVGNPAELLGCGEVIR